MRLVTPELIEADKEEIHVSTGLWSPFGRKCVWIVYLIHIDCVG